MIASGDSHPLGGLGCVSARTAFIRVFVAARDDIDELGHVNNTVYLRWVQDIATAHWKHIAPPAMQSAFVWVALRHEIDYREPVYLGESVEGRTWLGAADGPRFTRHVELRKPDASRFSARAVTQWCLLDTQSRRPLRVGADILAAFGLPG